MFCLTHSGEFKTDLKKINLAHMHEYTVHQDGSISELI